MKKTYFLILLLLSPVLLFAWGQKGHRIVAQIAYDNLTQYAQQQVDSLLSEKGIIWLANWPDEIRSDTVYPSSHDWHYQDLPAHLTEQQLFSTLTQYPSHGGNLWRALDSLNVCLHTNPLQKDALVFLIHLIGDSFCPMHLGHEDDLGGNKVKTRWFDSPANLHKIWDEHLIESQGYSYTEYAQYLQIKYIDEKETITNASKQDLVLQTYLLTQDIYTYQQTFDNNTYYYIYRWRNPMERQLYTAGIRLAALLNEIYKYNE